MKTSKHNIVNQTISFAVALQCRESITEKEDNFDYQEIGGFDCILLGIPEGQNYENANHFEVIFSDVIIDQVPKGVYYTDITCNVFDEFYREYLIDFYGKPDGGTQFLYRRFKIVSDFGVNGKAPEKVEDFQTFEKNIDLLMPIEMRKNQEVIKFPANSKSGHKICFFDMERVINEGKFNDFYYINSVIEFDVETQKFTSYEAPMDEEKPMICLAPYNSINGEGYGLFFTLELFYKGEEGKMFDYPKCFLEDLIWFKDFKKQVVGEDFLYRTAVMKNHYFKEYASLERAEAYKRIGSDFEKTGIVGFSGFRLNSLIEGSIAVYFKDHFYENLPIKEIRFNPESCEYSFVEEPDLSNENATYLITFPNGDLGVVIVEYQEYINFHIENEQADSGIWDPYVTSTYINTLTNEYDGFYKYYHI